MINSTSTAQGSTRLIFDSIEGITTAVEQMHETIAAGPLVFTPRGGKTTGAHGPIASSIYTAIRGVNGLLREGADHTFKLLPQQASTADQSSAAVRSIAALNGAFGDHLEATGNALAIPMALRTPDGELEINRDALATAIPRPSPNLVVLVHGLSLSELSWRRQGDPCIGSRLQEELDCSPLYLRYNTGRHISTNGRELSQLLQDLCAAWPVPVESLSLIGHSMGGLVIRSACWYAQQGEASWLQQTRRIVCLGTPHHGSSVAKAGHALDVAMQKIPYTAPLAFGKHRSAGIKDLRHGDLLDEDWQGHHADQPRGDTRRAVPLLPEVDYYFAAATLGADLGDPLGHLLGDLLVRMDSAVGSHKNTLKKLHIEPGNCRVFHEKNHFDLLNDTRVHQQILEWFQ